MQILTATGCRPAAWAMCERLMMAQTFDGPVRWIVVDDGPDQQPVSFERPGWLVEVIRPSPRWQPGQNTQARNLLAGLDAVDRMHPVAIIEDDDWYSPTWLQTVHEHLKRAELVGETRSRYYNVATRMGRDVGNTRHASLCATALRGRAIDTLRRVFLSHLVGGLAHAGQQPADASANAGADHDPHPPVHLGPLACCVGASMRHRIKLCNANLHGIVHHAGNHHGDAMPPTTTQTKKSPREAGWVAGLPRVGCGRPLGGVMHSGSASSRSALFIASMSAADYACISAQQSSKCKHSTSQGCLQ